MVVFHKALRREFGLLPGIVAAVRTGDARRATSVVMHTMAVLYLLLDHHDSEHRLVRTLRLRGALPGRVIDSLQDQHTAIETLMNRVAPALATWSTGGDASARERVSESVHQLTARLAEHFDLEEADIFPLIRDHLTVPEWNAAMSVVGAAPPPRMFTPWMIRVGSVVEMASAVEESWYLAGQPASARLLWRRIGRRSYARYIRSIREPA